MYPKRYSKSLRILMEEIGVDIKTAYTMLVITATLMDLHPEDAEVVDMILKDCGVEV